MKREGIRAIHLVWASLLAGVALEAGAQGSLNSRVPRRFALGADSVLESAKPEAAPYYAPMSGSWSGSLAVPGLEAIQRTDRGGGTHFDPKDSLADPELLSGTAVAGQGNRQNPFSHRIPIVLPPGINGMQPELALVYEPSSGNGVLGVGWKLEGLTAITRVNYGRGINYDGQDTYAHSELGILVKQSDGSYRTRKESFAQIVPAGTSGDGPRSWMVSDRSGKRFYYGLTESSRLYRGRSVRTWALERVEDPFGNTYDIQYASYGKDAGGNLYPATAGALGRLYPDAITYTNRASLSGQRRVEFEYEPRGDTEPGYYQSVEQQTVGRLRKVIVKSKGVLVREYRLSYQESPSTGRSRLTAVQEYGSQGGALPAQSFEWQDGGVALTLRTLEVPAPASVMVADFNGDGRTDIAQIRTEKHLVGNQETQHEVTKRVLSVRLSTGSQFAPAQDWRVWVTSEQATDQFAPVGTADVDGDGRADLVAIKTHSYEAGKESIEHYVRSAVWLRSTGTGFEKPVALCVDGPSTSLQDLKVRLGDFNGDRRADAVCIVDGKPNLGTMAGDYNGDGKTELAGREAGGIGVDRWEASQNRFVHAGWPVTFSGQLVSVGDFNGDGRSDLVAREGYRTTLLLSTGTGFVATAPVTFPRTENLTVGDFDGDGKSDLAAWYGGTLYLYRFTGSGFSYQYIPAAGSSAEGLMVGDFTGQGRHGLIGRVTASVSKAILYIQMAEVNSASGPFPDVLTAVHNGVGGSVYVSYQPATEVANAIQPGSSGPGVCDTTPAMLVSRVTAVDNRGGYRWTDYWYHDQRRLLGTIDQARELGFARIEAVEATPQQTLRQTRNLYRQDWPFERLAYEVAAWDGDGLLVSQWQYGYENCQAPQSACVETQWGLGQGTELVLESGSTAIEWEQGAEGYHHTASYVYDKYGNVKRVERGASGRPRVVVEVGYLEPEGWMLERVREIKVSEEGGAEPLKRATFEWSGPKVTARSEWLDSQRPITTTYEGYDEYGRVREVRGPMDRGSQRITRLEYDPASPSDLVQVTEILDPNDRTRDLTTSASYYGDGSLKTVTDPNGATTSYEYDELGRKSVEKRPDGGESRYAYLQSGQAVPDPADAESPTAAALYNRTVTWLDRYRKVVKYEYFDGSGFVYWTHTAGQCTPGESCAGMTQEPSVIVRRTKDAAGREVQSTAPRYLGQAVQLTRTEYDGRGRVSRVTTPDGKVTGYSYGTDYTEVSDPNGKVTRTYVNARGSVSKVVAALGTALEQASSYGYDALERPVSMAPPGQQPLLFTYDSMGRRTSMTDPQIGQRPVRFTYDALGRVTSQTPLEAGATPVTLRYDETAYGKGRLTSVSDAAGTTRFAYTAMGQLRAVTRELPNGGGKLAQSYQYNWVGQATAMTYPEGTVVGYGYTMRGNLEKVYFGSTAPGAGEEATKLIATWSGYDARGNPGNVKYGENGAATRYGYDAMGHLSSLQTTGAGKTMQDLVYDWYTAPNTGGLNIGRITDNRNPAASESYQYDDLYRLTQATGVWGIRTYSYDTAGNATAFGGLVNRVLSFNGQQLQSISSNGVTGAVEHDLYGNLTSKQEDGASWKYRWTTENFLESVEKAGAVVATMTYDAWGQRATKQSPTASTLYFGRSYEKRVSGGVAEETIYVYGNGQLIAHLSRTVTGATALSAPKSWRGELAAASMYDGASFTGAARKMYHWVNAAAMHPRAVQVAVQGLLLLFAAAVLAWLLLSRRTGRQSSYSPAMQWASLATLLVFSLSSCGGEGPSGFGPAPNEPTTTSTASLLFYHRNQVSSTTLVTDASGAEVARYVYLPFGEKDAAHFSGNDVTKRQFTSQERDDETGLDYFNARYYDPQIGRFISADTIIPDVMNGAAFNRYAYVLNNPVMHEDPDGRTPKGALIGGLIGGAVGGVAGFVIGGGGGVAVAICTGGLGAVAIPAGAVEGWAAGSGIGIIVGHFIGDALTGPNPSAAAPMPMQSKGMLGEDGVQIPGSKTLWRGEDGWRVDVENPDPGGRPGQIQVQRGSGKTKETILYDPRTGRFYDQKTKETVNTGELKKLLKDPEVQRALDKAAKMLGESSSEGGATGGPLAGDVP